MSKPKATVSSRQGKGLLRNKVQKFATDILWIEAELIKLATDAEDVEKRVYYMLKAKEVIIETLPYMLPRLSVVATGYDNEIAEQLLKDLKDPKPEVGFDGT